jgi:YidC/Oxa1 family membrane protein insertase
MILAIVLSAIVLIGWGFVTETWFPAANPPVTRTEQGRQVPLPQPQADPAADSPAAMRSRQIVLGETPRIRIETPRLAGSINLRGARIDDLVLTTQRETIERNSPPVRLFSPAGAPGAYFGGFGWTGQGLNAPNSDTVWQASGTRLTPTTPVTLSWDNGRGQVFQIRLSVDDGYMFTAEQRLLNRGTAPVAAQPFALVSRVGPSVDPDSWTVHVGPVGEFNGAAHYSSNWSDVTEAGTQRFDSRGGWIGFTDKYWLAAIVPAQGQQIEAAFRHNSQTNSFQADYSSRQQTIVPPGQGLRTTAHLFAGAKEEAVLSDYTAALGTRLDKAIDWGWFEWFMKPIFKLLHWLFIHLGNFGLAIIGLTVIVRLLLFPIAQKQFASMAAMRVVQPKMKAIQERYADDRAKMQEEMMKLYKEEKVNPLAGCLPIFLQIPIFYALYKVLLLSVEMRHQPFVGWIRDLSAADPLTPVNLFGFLPFTPPHFLIIGILPILVGVTMWLQMRLNPAPMDPVQKQVFALMPWVLIFVMAPFAAGLQLYWVTNNLLSIGQQKLLYLRHPQLKDAPAGAAPTPEPAAPAPRRNRKQ